MRDRHIPRLCRACARPMARQEDACWACGTRWAVEQTPPLRLIRGGDVREPGEPVTLEVDVAVAVALPVPVVSR